MIALYFSLTDFQENMEAMKHNFFSAKLKNQKSLNAGGEFLANNQFAFAVVVASAGMEGDTQKDLVLTEARAMVVREYLVFGFDDSQLRTLGMGKQAEANSETGWGTVQIFVYPSGLKFHRPKEHKRLCRLPNQVGSIGSSFHCHYPEAEVGVPSECFSPSECLHKARLTTEACLYERRPTLSFSHEKRHDSERPEHDVVNRCRHRVSGSEILPDRQLPKPKHKTEFRDQH